MPANKYEVRSVNASPQTPSDIVEADRAVSDTSTGRINFYEGELDLVASYLNVTFRKLPQGS